MSLGVLIDGINVVASDKATYSKKKDKKDDMIASSQSQLLGPKMADTGASVRGAFDLTIVGGLACYKKPSLDKSNSLKEQSAHIASVKNILESHASYLMSGKELSKLVAFVKGTQFDLVEYLQRERYGSARLENFASGLELIGQKVTKSFKTIKLLLCP
ncbi:hypothetical protein POTOM_010505 [Populus tomentosa]|uniref:Uncharacterized protein n=1 Tax=Populus tomentosa TaxID=118781 RepID=A0A8X8ADD6_POPTO|nr:hypothetical protein POTOM_010505 [Populus tomentosa]